MSTTMMYHESIERQPFGLSTFSTDIKTDYYDSLSGVCTMMCDKYATMTREDSHHICAFINTKDSKIFLGENSTRTMPGCPISTHAEMDVLRKVLKSKSIVPGVIPKRLDRFDVVVIRVSKTRKLGTSRPCYHCINSMMNTNYIKIRYVYYSTIDGKIVRERLDDMLESSLTRVSTGWRARTKKSPTSGYSSDESSSSSASSRSSSLSKSSTSSSDDRMYQIIDPVSGERINVSEKKYARVLKRK